MSPCLPLRSLLVTTLSALVLLTASAARADLPSERLYLSRVDVAEDALRNVIGVAFVHTAFDEERRPSGTLPRYLPSGDAFELAGTLAVKDLQALSGWDYDTALRKFPVVEQRGSYIHVVIDVRKNTRAWLRELPRDSTREGPSLQFLPFDSKGWQWTGVEYLDLAPGGQARLYLAAREDARSHPLSVAQPPRLEGEAVELRIIRTKGNFMQVGAMVDLDQPLVPMGWLRMTDEEGLLLVWPIFASMC
ncbi:hypothetical protein [Pyxidicoccus xibeiensis]|uniref:hypothetical protein n=1 Tax=Pyxidicoccus xibeiensis TaxID=2906759 RepID=UPI0020A79155|nr:hypothetical protein [Pyxidicoccus xibeiensis]MCP3138648.1 hypothetical protein [Pyxidicoccus xibeiensis]